MLHMYWYSVHSSLKLYQSSFHTSSSLLSIASDSGTHHGCSMMWNTGSGRPYTRSTTNLELYSLAFTGKALGINWCPICQVEGGNHTYDCPQFLQPATSPAGPRPQLPSAQPLRRSIPCPAEPPAKQPTPAHCQQKRGAVPLWRLLKVPARLLLLLWPTPSALLSH